MTIKPSDQQLVIKSDCILYQDPCGRYWKLVPVMNPQVMVPFLIKPLTAEQFDEAK